jgi:hypothetical protein
MTIPAAILNGIALALQIANSEQAAEIIADAKRLFATLFRHGLITKEQQDATSKYLDGLEAMVLAGIVPPHWQVQPDPQ